MACQEVELCRFLEPRTRGHSALVGTARGEAVDLVSFVIMFAVFLLSVSIHESAHAYAAWRLGDDTAARLGRITLNPIYHIDPILTIVVPVILALTVGVPFGGAKPVPVNVGNLRDPRRDMMWIAWAGPASNLVQAAAFAVLWFLVLLLARVFGLPDELLRMVTIMCYGGVLVNLVLGGFNMIPVPPLDGSRILAALLPESAARTLDRIEPIGFFVVLGLIMLGVTDYFLRPLQLLAQFVFQLPRWL